MRASRRAGDDGCTKRRGSPRSSRSTATPTSPTTTSGRTCPTSPTGTHSSRPRTPRGSRRTGRRRRCTSARDAPRHPDLPLSERADLYARLASELAAVDENEEAAEHFAMAIDLLPHGGGRSGGRPARSATDVGEASRRRSARDAHATGSRCARPAERRRHRPGRRVPPLVRFELFAALAAAYMLDRRLYTAIEYGTNAAAIRLPHDPDDVATLAARVNLDATLGSVLVFAGRMEEGWRLLENAVTTGRKAGSRGGDRARVPDARVVRIRPRRVRPRRTLARGGARVHRADGALERPPLPGLASGARVLGARRLATRRARGETRARGWARRDHDARDGADRARVPRRRARRHRRGARGSRRGPRRSAST